MKQTEWSKKAQDELNTIYSLLNQSANSLEKKRQLGDGSSATDVSHLQLSLQERAVLFYKEFSPNHDDSLFYSEFKKIVELSDKVKNKPSLEYTVFLLNGFFYGLLSQNKNSWSAYYDNLRQEISKK